MIFNVTGGGGTGLNFKVVGGTVQPANPKENTVWVYTDTPVSDWAFSSAGCGNPREGTVLFVTGEESTAQFNALKKNTIRLCPASARQYRSGVWVDVEAFVFQNGDRVRISEGLAYDILNGTALTDYSGGWTGTGDAEVSTSPMTTGYVSVSTDGTTSGRVVMDTPISAFGKYKTLSFTANSSQVARFQIYSAGGEVAASQFLAGGTSPVSSTIDISGLSKTETYTCGLSISGSGSAASARVSKIRLE